MDNEQTALIIKKELKNKKKTITNMIEELNLGKSFMQNLINKGSKPSVETMENIADYLNISLDYLIGRTNEQGIKNVTYGNYSPIGKNNTLTNIKLDEMPIITLAIIGELKDIPEEEQADLFKALKNRKKEKNKNVM